MKAPDWTEKQFRTVLANLDRTSGAISSLIPRSVGAIDCVRAGIKDYRGGGSSGILSKMMRDILAAQ